jgi:hypothetical protein
MRDRNHLRLGADRVGLTPQQHFGWLAIDGGVDSRANTGIAAVELAAHYQHPRINHKDSVSSSRPQRRHSHHRTQLQPGIYPCQLAGAYPDSRPRPATAAEKIRGGLSGFLFATSINVHELPVEVVPQRVLDKTRYVSKVVDGEVFKRGSEGINGLREVLRSGWFFGEAIA